MAQKQQEQYAGVSMAAALMLVVGVAIGRWSVSAPAASAEKPSSAITKLAEDQTAEFDACLRAYVNRRLSPDMVTRASTSCLQASLDLPKGSPQAAYAGAMHEAADAIFYSDEIEQKRLEKKADDLKWAGPVG